MFPSKCRQMNRNQFFGLVCIYFLHAIPCFELIFRFSASCDHVGRFMCMFFLFCKRLDLKHQVLLLFYIKIQFEANARLDSYVLAIFCSLFYRKYSNMNLKWVCKRVRRWWWCVTSSILLKRERCERDILSMLCFD